MKKYPVYVIIFVFLIGKLSAQQVVPERIVIFGVDCSLAKIVTRNNYNRDTLVRVDIPRLNQEMIKICSQYKGRFAAKEFLVDTTEVNRINKQISSTALIIDSRYQFINGDKPVREELKKYNISAYANKPGVGYLFVMEKIDERADRESFYIVLFDLQTKEIIHCDKVETGLSKIKNAVGSGWFSWKTGILKTVSAMDDVYDFWNSYPENEKIDITQKK